MLRFLKACLAVCPLLACSLAPPSFSQDSTGPTAPLREIHADGFKSFTEEQVIGLIGLQPGTQVGKKDLQTGADHLVQSGLFKKVNYSFQTLASGVHVTYHVEESPRIPAYFDNIPWFADSELAEAIRKKNPLFDGTLPEGGGAVDQAIEAVKELIATKGLNVSLEHEVIPNPVGEGNVQEFRIEGGGMQIADIEFGDPALSASKVVRQQLADIRGKPYSRMTIDLFLTEAIRPIYQQQGCLRAKLGPPEIRLHGDPNQKLPDQIPVFVPVEPGAVYHLKELDWTGNTTVSEFTLSGAVDMKPGDVADGMKLEAGWDRAREEYAHRGFLEAKLEPAATYDDQAHTISYAVNVQEGPQYHFGKMVLTGISPAAERKLHAAWPIATGDVFDKAKYEEILVKLQAHQEQIFGELPLHYDTVGHWLQTDAASATVDVLLDFK
jgi:outer membrane protein insertion porin family